MVRYVSRPPRRQRDGARWPTGTRRMHDMAEQHGMRGTPEYNAWRNMIQRCTNPNATGWKDYGGRGITVCDAWRESFDAFMVCMGSRPEGLSLDRKDNSGNYDPWNCHWATWEEQQRNQRPWSEHQAGLLPPCNVCGQPTASIYG